LIKYLALLTARLLLRLPVSALAANGPTYLPLGQKTRPKPGQVFI
jgi:hypothetical protein